MSKIQRKECEFYVNGEFWKKIILPNPKVGYFGVPAVWPPNIKNNKRIFERRWYQFWRPKWWMNPKYPKLVVYETVFFQAHYIKCGSKEQHLKKIFKLNDPRICFEGDELIFKEEPPDEK